MGNLLYHVSCNTNQDPFCMNNCDLCKKLCMNRLSVEISFPCFLQTGDIVEYSGDFYGKTHKNYCYAGHDSDEMIDSCLLILLDMNRDYSNEDILNFHSHISAAVINLKPDFKITKEERRNAVSLCQLLYR